MNLFARCGKRTGGAKRARAGTFACLTLLINTTGRPSCSPAREKITVRGVLLTSQTNECPTSGKFVKRKAALDLVICTEDVTASFWE